MRLPPSVMIVLLGTVVDNDVGVGDTAILENLLILLRVRNLTVFVPLTLILSRRYTPAQCCLNLYTLPLATPARAPGMY